VHGKRHLPDDYDFEEWKQTAQDAPAFIKKHFPDKMVVFNGVSWKYGTEESLEFANGGLCKSWPFNARKDKYMGERALERHQWYSREKQA
jgi:hypothetical protein